MLDQIDAGSALGDMLHTVVRAVPTFVAFVAVLGAGWLVARIARRAGTALLRRLGFERLVERGGLTGLLPRPDAATELVGRLVFCAVLLVAAQLAFGLWGRNPVSDLIGAVVGWLPQAAVAVVIVVVTAAVARAVRTAVGTTLGSLGYGRALATVASGLVLGLGLIAALNQIGVAASVTTPLLIAVLGTVGGILVVGAGGGLIRPMQHRWERLLNQAEVQIRTTDVGAQASAYLAGHRAAGDAAAQPAAAGAAAGLAVPTFDPDPPVPPGGWPTLNDPVG